MDKKEISLQTHDTDQPVSDYHETKSLFFSWQQLLHGKVNSNDIKEQLSTIGKI